MKRNSGKIVSWWAKPSHATWLIEAAAASVTAEGHKPHTATTSDANPMMKSMSNPRRASSDINLSDCFIILPARKPEHAPNGAPDIGAGLHLSFLQR